MAASEAAPYAKTGGLADVLGALPAALAALGHDVAVVLPRYQFIPLRETRRVYDDLPVSLGSTVYHTALHQIDGKVSYFFVDCPPLYDRPGLYGENGLDYPDNHIRFAVFARAALEVVRRVFRVDVLHCHDWQAGLVPVYLKTVMSTDPTFLGVRTLFTIHNLGYQGLFGRDVLPEIGLTDDLFIPGRLEFWGNISFIKGGLVYADALNTVSPTYAREIQTPEYGFGLDGVLRARSNVLSGILNGVDYSEWDPQTDPNLPARYSSSDLSGKSICKRELVREFGLPEDTFERPLIGIISRLTSQKGADLIEASIGNIIGLGFSLVVLGAGEPEYEEMFTRMAAAHPERVALRLGYDNGLAHRIEAGSDLFLMPSRYEPCGLNQIYSLRYGTIPIVRATGGLDDTIEEGTGFKFWDYSAEALTDALRAARDAFADQDRWSAMMRRAMAEDFSWQVSARQYSDLYGLLRGRP